MKEGLSLLVCAVGLSALCISCGDEGGASAGGAGGSQAGSSGSGASGGSSSGGSGAGTSGGSSSGGSSSGGSSSGGSSPGGSSPGGSSSGGAGGSSGGGSGGGAGLSSAYPGDVGISEDPSVIFHSDFESDFAGWTSYTQNPSRLSVESDAGQAHGGSKYLRANITRTMLASEQYISAQARFTFPERVPELYWRFYAQYVGETTVPHHWVRVAASIAGFNTDGMAGLRPQGDQAFWFNLDAQDDGSFKFYTYWHEMRSWMCNDGSTDPGCAGYNGPGGSAYYGNNFNPAGQSPFPRDSWFCVEIYAKANTPGAYDGELAFFIDDQLVGEYRTGTPRGRWLRENFFSHGQYFQDEQAFEGFNFRTSEDVELKSITIDAYYQRDTLDAKEDRGISVPEAQTTYYDDVVAATARVGCKVPGN